MSKTTIEWCDRTDNPVYVPKPDGKVAGHWCRKVSDECLHCYSEYQNNNPRFGKDAWGSRLRFSGDDPPKLELSRKMLDGWRRTKKDERVFLCSMTDWMGDWLPEEWSFEILDAMSQSTLIFLTLTKRAGILNVRAKLWLESRGRDRVPDNIWLGVSAGRLCHYESRVPLLVEIPGNHWVSIEPMLEGFGAVNMGGIDWMVLGGESHCDPKRARPCHLEWLSAMERQCRMNKVDCFVKQLGSNPYLGGLPYKLSRLNRKGGNLEEFPDHLKTRNLPHCNYV